MIPNRVKYTAVAIMTTAGLISTSSVEPSTAQTTSPPLPNVAAVPAPPPASVEMDPPVGRPRKTKWETAQRRGGANVAAQTACREMFEGLNGVTAVIGSAASGKDLAGWTYADAKAVKKQLRARAASASVALCWVDLRGDTGPMRRALYAVDPDQTPELLAVGEPTEISLTLPQYKNVPKPKAEPLMSPDVTVPIVEYGPAEQADAERVRREPAPPVTVPKEDFNEPVPGNRVPSKLARRKLLDLEAEARARAKTNIVKPDPLRPGVTTPPVTLPPTTTPATAPTTISSSVTSAPELSPVTPKPGEKQVTGKLAPSFKAGPKLQTRNGRVFADAISGADVSFATDASADELLNVAVGTNPSLSSLLLPA